MLPYRWLCMLGVWLALATLTSHYWHQTASCASMQSKDAAIKAAARCVDIPLTQRQLCAARLIALADTLDKQQQQQHHGKGKGKQQQQADAQPPQQQSQQEYLGGVAAFVTKLQQSGAAQLATAAEGQEAAAEQAQQAASTLQQTLQRMQARLDAGGSSAGEQQRVRALAHLLRLVLLHSLADPAAADPSLAADLEAVYAVAVEGQPAPQRAVQQPAAQLGGSGSDDDMEEGEEEEQQPHWHDTLMDVLLSLLARNAAPLPSAPLRDAVDHVFRAFGEDLTPTGGKADLAAHGLCCARLACNLAVDCSACHYASRGAWPLCSI
jgi:hypothetical protein